MVNSICDVFLKHVWLSFHVYYTECCCFLVGQGLPGLCRLLRQPEAGHA